MARVLVTVNPYHTTLTQDTKNTYYYCAENEAHLYAEKLAKETNNSEIHIYRLAEVHQYTFEVSCKKYAHQPNGEKIPL
jgi:hypothetical protein